MKQSYVRWYIAKVKNRTEKKIKEYLDRVGAETFLPLQPDGQPLLPGTLFVRSDRETALSFPQSSGLLMDYQYDPATHQLQYVPDRQMETFRFIHSFSEQLLLLPNPENLKNGEKVKVVKGDLAGIEGELYRIKGHKRLVVKLDGLATVAMNYMPREWMERVL